MLSAACPAISTDSPATEPLSANADLAFDDAYLAQHDAITASVVVGVLFAAASASAPVQ
jgi:hypothetical protein